MLNRLLPTLALSLLLSSGFTQNTVTDSSATCVAYWKKGDVKTVTINKTSINYKKTKPPETTKATCKAIMTILEESETGYKIQWQYKVDNSAPGISDLSKFNELLTNLKIIYTTSETGAYDSLVNYEEVKKFMSTTLNEIGKLKKYESPEFQKFLDQFKTLLENRQGIEGFLMKDINVLHSPYGIEYDKKHPQVFESELPNIFGGEPFPAVVTLSLLKLDATNNSAKIRILQTIDKEKSAAILKEILIKLATPIRADAKEGIESAGIDSIELNDSYEFDLSLNNGWMKKVLFTRLINVAGSKKTDITEIIIK
jgi:hypothetical protein